MSLAELVRLLITLAGAAVCVGMLGVLGWTWTMVFTVLSIFIATSLIGDRIYRRMATLEQQRVDLADRVRNPPD